MLEVATISQIVRFGCVGLLATAVHYAVALTISLLASPYAANVGGYCAAVAISYFGHQHFTFRIHREAGAHTTRLPRFLITSLSALVLSQLVVALTGAIELPSHVQLAAAVLVVPPYTFVMSRLWVFHAPSSRGASESD